MSFVKFIWTQGLAARPPGNNNYGFFLTGAFFTGGFAVAVFFGAGFALGVTGVGETETVGVTGFLAAGFFFGGAVTTEVTR